MAGKLADTVTFVMPQTETRAETVQRVEHFDNHRDLELALHVPVIGDSVAPFMAGPDTDPAAVRAADSLAYLPAIRRRLPRKSNGDVTRSASPTSYSEPTSPVPSLRSSPN